MPREGEPKPLSYALLRDRGNQAAAAYGLVFTLPPALKEVYLKVGIDLTKANGDASWTLPVPARFVVDRGGVIRSVDADPDYTRRPEPSATLEVLRALKA